MEKFTRILETIKVSWEELNPIPLATVLAEKIIYHEDPNEPPLTSPEQVIERWTKDLATHSEVHLSYEVIDIEGENCITSWHAEWKDSERGHRVLHGVYYLSVNSAGKLQEFRQWWV